MEGRLIGLSMWCALYAFGVRWVARHEEWLEKKSTIMLLNSFFWGTVGAVIGMLFASYTEKLEDTTQYSLVFAVVGLVFGAVRGYMTSQDEEHRDAHDQRQLGMGRHRFLRHPARLARDVFRGAGV